MKKYFLQKEVQKWPRLPLEGNIDLTYRCNNDCVHCWLRPSSDSRLAEPELSVEEIKGIVAAARKMGCRKWAISGGEPMLRDDFEEIFDFITALSVSYALNTNGTLITPRIARLMKRPGIKMIALYGPSAAVHDAITRNPGSFEALMMGLSYLREAGAGFMIQIVPLRANENKFADIIRLAETFSPVWKIGASWLNLSADGDPAKNREILDQRIAPEILAAILEPSGSSREERDAEIACPPVCEESHFSSCLAGRRDFHIDPYGGMSFCAYVKDPNLRSNLREHDFAKIWDELIPEAARSVEPDPEYERDCGSCVMRKDCSWCPVYGYLEHGRYDAKVEYLCP